jgi:hypothetical protein
MKKIWAGVLKAIGVDQERAAAKKWHDVALSPRQPIPRVPRRRSRGWNPDIRMRRGVQKSLEKKQRLGRLTWIRGSVRQAITIALRRRRSQVLDRETGRHERMLAFRKSMKGIA